MAGKESPRYVPEPAPDTDTRELSEYTERELRRVGDKFVTPGDTVWRDMTADLLAAKTPGTKPPTMTAFGPAGGAGHMKQQAFTIGDNVWVNFHVNHDIKRGGKAYVHVHWSSDGTDVNPVVWDIDIQMAKGHDQEAFPADVNFQLSQAGSGTAWQHMIVEAATGTSGELTLAEPDILICLHIERVTNGATDNTDTIYGLYVDLHYEADDFHNGTRHRDPDFWRK